MPFRRASLVPRHAEWRAISRRTRHAKRTRARKRIGGSERGKLMRSDQPLRPLRPAPPVRVGAGRRRPAFGAPCPGCCAWSRGRCARFWPALRLGPLSPVVMWRGISDKAGHNVRSAKFGPSQGGPSDRRASRCYLWTKRMLWCYLHPDHGDPGHGGHISSLRSKRIGPDLCRDEHRVTAPLPAIWVRPWPQVFADWIPRSPRSVRQGGLDRPTPPATDLRSVNATDTWVPGSICGFSSYEATFRTRWRVEVGNGRTSASKPTPD
jgi:hypothetical protein